MSENYSELDLKAIWSRGQLVLGYDPQLYRVDVLGSPIIWNQYGNRESIYGWEVDHIDPCKPAILSNLQPLQWQNNVAKSDKKLQY